MYWISSSDPIDTVFKQRADQGDTTAQYCYGFCLHYDKGVSNDLRSAAHYFKLSADQENVKARYHSGMCLLRGLGLQRDLSGAI
jgi:TPR repeat protein